MYPAWKFANYIILRLFHMPKANCLTSLFCDFVHVRDQLADPPTTTQRNFLTIQLKDLILSLCY